MLKERCNLRFNGSVWVNLDIALRHIDQQVRNHIRGTGLTVIEWYILRALYDTDGQHASQLAHEVGRAATSFTPNLDKLQDKGYVSRNPDPSDRRAVRIYLTDKAKLERDKLLKLAQELDEHFEMQLSRDEVDCFHTVLAELQTAEVN